MEAEDEPMKKVVNRASLHDEPDEIAYWLTRPVAERVAAVEVLRQRVFGYTPATRTGIERVARVVQRLPDSAEGER